MPRVGSCRLSPEGVAAIQKAYQRGRWANVAAFCEEKGIHRSVYFDLTKRVKWFEKDTIEDKLNAIGIPDFRHEKYYEFKDYEFKQIEPQWPRNLPAPLTSFIGREQEMADVQQRLASTRLLTLVGAGGCGKTRLALQIAANLRSDYGDGVWLVELAALSDSAFLPQAVLSALALREQPGQSPLQTLTEYLKPRKLLLILDNCEHLLEACAQIADTLLRACPNLKILTTSREDLNILGETVRRVPSLSLPDARALPLAEKELAPALMEYDAVRLFVERARSKQTDFPLNRNNALAVAQICQRLDGIPLAIELASVWVRELTPEQIAGRLDDRFRLLAAGNKTAPSRQQTLRATFDWSYDLLSANERLLFARLSVFAGGWTLEAAETVGMDSTQSEEGIQIAQVLDLLTALADKNLILAEKQGTAFRYRMLETARAYAQEKLQEFGEVEPLRNGHREWYAALAEAADPQLSGPEQKEWLERLETERENLRAALAWRGGEKDSEAGLRLAGALGRFWEMRGYLSEGSAYLEQALAAGDRQTPSLSRANALQSAGILAWRLGDPAVAQERHAQSLILFENLEDKAGIARARSGLGVVAYSSGDYSLAQTHHEASLRLRREIGDKQGAAISLNNLGNIAADIGDYTQARSWYEESLRLSREIGYQGGIANALTNLGHLFHQQGDYLAARERHEDSLAIRRELEDRVGIASSLSNLGNLLHDWREFDAAREYVEESLEIRRSLNDRGGIANSLGVLGNIAYSQGNQALAEKLHEESLAIFREMGHRRGMGQSLAYLGLAVYEQGDYDRAWQLFEESLSIRRQLQDKEGTAETLEGMAWVLLARKKFSQAVHLWEAAAYLRKSIQSPLSLHDKEKYAPRVAQARDALGEAAFEAAAGEGRAMDWEQSIEYALANRGH